VGYKAIDWLIDYFKSKRLTNQSDRLVRFAIQKHPILNLSARFVPNNSFLAFEDLVSFKKCKWYVLLEGVSEKILAPLHLQGLSIRPIACFWWVFFEHQFLLTCIIHSFSTILIFLLQKGAFSRFFQTTFLHHIFLVYLYFCDL